MNREDEEKGGNFFKVAHSRKKWKIKEEEERR